MPEASYQIKGSVPRHHHQLLGPCDASDHIEFTVKLKRKSEDGLPTLDEFIAGKRAVGLTRKSLEEKNGASEDAADAVRAWARQQGLSVAAVDLGKRDMRIVGTIAAVEKAFQIHLQKYRHMRLNVDFRCPDKDVSVPESLSKYVMGVIGLNDMPVVVRNGARVARNPQSADPKTLYPGSFYPNEVAKLYGFPQAQGKGQRVAILEFGGGFNQNTLANYFSKHIGLADNADRQSGLGAGHADEHQRWRDRRSLSRHRSRRRHGAAGDDRCLLRALDRTRLSRRDRAGGAQRRLRRRVDQLRDRRGPAGRLPPIPAGRRSTSSSTKLSARPPRSAFPCLFPPATRVRAACAGNCRTARR